MNKYFEKYAFRPPLIAGQPDSDVDIIVVIPCKNESKLLESLSSLASCTQPHCSVEVIVVFNASENDSQAIKEQNQISLEFALKWCKAMSTSNWLKFYFISENNLPKKHAGVGLARKIGMDEALRRFAILDNKDGIIACFDADTRCETNYFNAIKEHFHQHPKTPGCSIKFEHPTSGDIYEPAIYKGIINYELHLRYYKQAMHFSGFPFAFHTIGSSMAVRSTAYEKQGGMNRRQAGEDFYFLHKIIALGNFSELNETCIYPSPRISDRVPFGTGKAIGDYIRSGQEDFFSYNFKSFEYLRLFFLCIPEFYLSKPLLKDLKNILPPILISFLETYFFDERLKEIKANSKNINSFTKRFYTWFNAFMILKFVHYSRDNAFPDVKVSKSSLDLLRAIKYPEVNREFTVYQLLQVFRKLDERVYIKSIY